MSSNDLLSRIKNNTGEDPIGRSQWPWQRRPSIYDPPTLLDSLLSSPLQLLTSRIYFALLHLRGAPFRPSSTKPAIRIVCISDTHNNLPAPIPAGDLLIHCGDLTNAGTLAEIQIELDWLASLPHKHKIVIAGNHDSFFDPKSRRPQDRESDKTLDFYDLHYLEHESVKINFEGGRSLNFYGSPDIPEISGHDEFAFQYPRHEPTWHNRVPLETDVLITHTPPRHHLDLDLGCDGLLKEVWRVKPKLHVFGHIHSGHGRQSVFWDEAQAAFEDFLGHEKGGVSRDMLPSSAWISAMRVFWYSFRNLVTSRLSIGTRKIEGGLMVNAAMVYRNTTVIGNPPEVVDL